MSDEAVEEALQRGLGLTELKDTGIRGKGLICSGSAYDTDKYGTVYIKFNNKPKGKIMFDGEYASLEALRTTNTVRVPRPIKVLDIPGGGAALVMQYMDMIPGGVPRSATVLGGQIARLHRHNASLKERAQKTDSSVHKKDSAPQYVAQFGFPVNTCCGYIEMDNTWTTDWPSFFADKIETQVRLLEINTGDRQVREAWNSIVPKLPRLFDGPVIEPVLLHGDLWAGNVAESDHGPVVFDPAARYGHSEFDLSIGLLFGGFSPDFYTAYHNVVPKAAGFDRRLDLYAVFNYVNHWNHFGEDYKERTFAALQACAQYLSS